jgi:hypothetical protein
MISEELTFRRGLPYSWQGPPRYPKAVSGDLRRFFVTRIENTNYTNCCELALLDCFDPWRYNNSCNVFWGLAMTGKEMNRNDGPSTSSG